METWTKTCGPIPGGFILTHTHMVRSFPLAEVLILDDSGSMNTAAKPPSQRTLFEAGRFSNTGACSPRCLLACCIVGSYLDFSVPSCQLIFQIRLPNDGLLEGKVAGKSGYLGIQALSLRRRVNGLLSFCGTGWICVLEVSSRDDGVL